uniref:PI-PLC Y-box domain-containing protein n=1 Tax=viral metagenome TaxID=1070528 RepID=A0A6C0I1H3_9ZZZZ
MSENNFEDVKNKLESKILLLKSMVSQVPNTMLIHVIGCTLIFFIMGCMAYYIYYKYTLLPKSCARLNKKKAPALNSNWITTASSDPSSQFLLRDYYVKTAYNCCSTGNFSNDYVSTCALQNAIKMGCRCLDFEVYGYKGQPIISTSLSDDKCIKETYNSVPFDEAMSTIATNAFSTNSTVCPNPSDPLLLLFRLKTNDVDVLNSMAESISSNLKDRLMPEYNHEFGGKNISAEPMTKFAGKVIIVVEAIPLLYQPGAEKMYEVTNLTSNAFLRILKVFDVLNSPDITELTTFNKQYMTIVIPDDSMSVNNYDPMPPSLAGCQAMAMSFQLSRDGNLNVYNDWFQAGPSKSAFLLKPADLMFKPQTIPVPTPQNPALSFASRPLKSDMYSFSI